MKSRIIVIVVIALIVVGGVLYFIFSRAPGGTGGGNGNVGGPGNGTPAAPAISVSQAYPNAPAGSSISIGTSHGIVQVNNVYAMSGTQIGDDGVLIIKQTSNYWFTYDPSSSGFWIAIS